MNAPAGPILLEARGISATFYLGQGFMRARRPFRAVDGVDLSIRPGEVLALVGESGCGKTTLARMLPGLLAPSGGEIRMDGLPLRELARSEVARLVQPIFQDPYSSLNPRKSIGSIIALPLKVQGGEDPSTWRRRIEAMMEMVGLPRTLYVSVQSQILNLLQMLRRELGLSYLLISHNLAVVEHMASRVAVMYRGRIVEEAETDALYRNPGHPHTVALLRSVLTPEPGLGIPNTREDSEREK